MIESFPTEASFEPATVTPQIPLVVQRLARSLADEASYQQDPAPTAKATGTDALLKTLADGDAAEKANAAQAAAELAATAKRNAVAAFVAFALAVTGIFTLALPLGMLSLYLSVRAMIGLRQEHEPRRQPMSFAVLAMLVGAVDTTIAMCRLFAALWDMFEQMNG